MLDKFATARSEGPDNRYQLSGFALVHVPGCPYKYLPIRVNANEKLLTLIGLDQR